MLRKYCALLLVALFIAFLYGCHNGGDYITVNYGADSGDVTTSIDRMVNDEGTFPAINFFNSGATIEVKEAGTMQKGVKLTVKERKTADTGLNPLGIPAYVYIYTITAELDTKDSLGNSVSIPVYSLEKPLTFRLSTAHLGTNGVCYAGVRKSDSDFWKYTRLSDSGTSILNLRAAQDNILSDQYTIDLYRVGIQIALFSYNPESGTEVTAVDGMTASNTSVVAYKDNKYSEDLKVDLLLEGLNLDKINSSDVKVIVTYRNRSEANTPIRTNNTDCIYDTSAGRSDEAVSGKGVYAHSFTVNGLPQAVSDGIRSAYCFTINLAGIALDEFPSDFTVEIVCESKDKSQIPFSYSKHLTFETKEEKTQVISYKITYELDGGSLAVSNPKSYDVTSATITLNNPTKDGYDFIGWTGTGIEGDASMTVTIPQGSTGNRKYIANYTSRYVPPTVYSITYHNIEDCTIADNPTSYDTSSPTITLNNPSKDGYTFAGWTGTGIEGDASMTVTIPQGSIGKREYTACFTPINYTITYEPSAAQGTNPAFYDITSATIILASPTPETGYEFIGWTGSNGEIPQLEVTIPQGSAENKSYKANFTPISYTITYDPLEAQGSNPVCYDIASATITLIPPTPETGYEFAGWTGSNGEIPQLEVTIPQGSTENKSYKANFTPISYTITYDPLEAQGSNPVCYDIASATITLIPPTPETGYEFAGWTGSNGEIPQLEVTIPQGSTENKSYKANFTVVPYTISYDLDGGTLAEANPQSYDITSTTITLNNPTRNGYDFIGWTGTDISEAITTVTIAQGSTGNREYTANWEPASVITFNLPDNVFLEVRRIPAGTFDRSGRGTYCDDKTVAITCNFYMGTFEVTQAQYKAVMDGVNPSEFIGDNLPVESVSYNTICEANGFLDKINEKLADQLPAGYRFALPTEAQWEYACRAGTTTDLNSNKNILDDFDTCDNTNEVAWNDYNSDYTTHVVGTVGTTETMPGASTASNSFGLYDMHGNVFEWCGDWFGNYDPNDLTDPVGPATGSSRVNRGGGFSSDPIFCASWFRNSANPSTSGSLRGFRLVLVPIP